MLPHLPSSLHLNRVTWQQAAAASTALVAVGGLLLYASLRKKESPEEIELQRRTFLAHEGRIIDGSIIGIDGSTEDDSADGTLDVPLDYLATPHVLIYRYRIAGVTYEASQDVSSLAEHVRNVRVDLPAQVRYDPRNPGNSILVAEGWNGVQHEASIAHHPDLQHMNETPGLD